MLHKTDLGGEWTLQVDTDGPTSIPVEAAALTGHRIPATVPGAVHADLRRADLIPDPNLDDNEKVVAWVGRTDWSLQRKVGILAGDAERVDLVFEGIDTVAQIEVDGVEIGRTRNMHRSYRFDVTEFAGAERDLMVRFTSAYTEAEKWQAELGRRPNAYPEPFNYVRKMACSFGWDWGLTLVTAGLWRPVRLESWSTARIASVRPLVDVDGNTGVLEAHIEVERTSTGASRELTATVAVAGVSSTVVLPAGRNEILVRLEVPDVKPWNPRGYGEPNLYDVAVTLLDDQQTELDVAHRRVGFRRVELDRSFDEVGSQFTFVINGKRIFAKGVNWIPDSVLPGTLTRGHYERRLREAYDANVNLVRVWGGGIYEDHAFYDVCDELGLLTWQDFLFACASYPEDEPLKGEILAEARDNVTRLSAHPSLALWNGNNENLWLHEVTHWEDQEGGQLPWGERYYLEWLPHIVTQLDPSRPYTDGSPWSGSWDYEPNDPNHQTMHSWEVWNREDYVNYRDSAPRFMSEFGWQAPPAWRTIRDAVKDEPLTPESPGVLHHQKAEDGNGKLERGLAPHFPVPADFDAWHFLTQLNQVDAVRTGVMHWRSNWPHTAGAVIWQLNDLWPVTSWAAIDGEGRYKPLYFAMKEMFAERAISIEPRPAGGFDLTVMNDTDEPWRGEASILRIDGIGNVLARQEVPVHAEARSVQREVLDDNVAVFGDASAELLVANLRGSRAYRFGAEPKDSTIQEESPRVSVAKVAGGLDITVTALTIARDVLVQPDRIHSRAVVDRGFLTLLPGESALFRVRADVELNVEDADQPYAVTSLGAVLLQSRTIVQL